MGARQHHTTAGSLIQQAANAEPQVAGARRARGAGHEVTAIGGRKLVAWSPRADAVFEILEGAIEATLDPGKPDALEKLTDFLGRRAVVTRPALRDTEVLPLLQETTDAINKHIAVGVAKLETRNASVACSSIVRRVYEEVAHLQTRIEAAVAHALIPACLLDRIDNAVREADAGAAPMLAALRRLKGRAETEPARIDEDLAASAAAVREAEEHLRIVAHETTRTRLFGVERALAQVRREVHVTVPQLSRERVAQMYLVPFRAGILDLERALDDRAQQLEARLRTLRELHDQLRAARADELGRLNGGRVRVVGAPRSEAARRAAADQVVHAVADSVARELRDLLVWKAPADRLLGEALALVRDRVDAQAPVPSIDDALLDGADPEKVAVELDQLVRDATVPVVFQPGADHARLRDWRCCVIRMPAGARIADGMIRYASYRADVFDFTGPADAIEILVWQPGISIRSTRLFHGGTLPHREENADPAAPPIGTLGEHVLRALRRSASTRRGRK
jgi:hypothetical protein